MQKINRLVWNLIFVTTWLCGGSIVKAEVIIHHPPQNRIISVSDNCQELLDLSKEYLDEYRKTINEFEKAIDVSCDVDYSEKAISEMSCYKLKKKKRKLKSLEEKFNYKLEESRKKYNHQIESARQACGSGRIEKYSKIIRESSNNRHILDNNKSNMQDVLRDCVKIWREIRKQRSDC